MELISLKVKGISYSETQSGAYALILSEKDGNRKLPVIIGGFEAQSIAIAIEDEIKPSRPLTHDLFKTFGDKFNISVSKMVIHKLIEGVFHSTLYCKNLINSEEIEIDSRTSDAIAIAIRFSCPIFTYEDILSRASILSVSSFDKENIKSTIDHKEKKINKYSLKELQESLKQAIKVENYEKASKIRDEIKRRTS